MARLQELLPEVQLILRTLPPKEEAPSGTKGARDGSRWQGQSLGRLLFEEMKAQLKKALKIWPLSSVVLGGFGAGGTAALLGLLYPQLAGIASCSSFLADGFPEQQAEPGTDQLILLTHGVEDQVVPISAARDQLQSLQSHGYRAAPWLAIRRIALCNAVHTLARIYICVCL